MSATGEPVFACFNADAICSSVYFDFYMSQLLAHRLLKPENFYSKWIEDREDENH